MHRKKLWQKSRKKRILASILCFCMLIPGLVTSADTISETENKISQLESEKAELDEKLSQLKDDESQKVEYQQTLQEKIQNVQDQIRQAREDINVLDDEIVVLEAKLQKSEEEMSDTLELFKRRVKAIYQSGSSTISTLEILLNSSSLHEFSMRNEALKSFSEHDKQLMEKISEYMKSTEDERIQCQDKKDKVAELKLGFEKNQQELEALNAENQSAREEIRNLQIETETRISENEDESLELMAELEQAIAARAERERQAREAAAAASAAQNTGSTSAGDFSGAYSPGTIFPDASSTTFTWPIPGVYTITQHYGNNGHNGMDIAGAYGTPIVAAEEGEVIVANNYDPWGDSWGYYVLIYHNSTYTTRYAHLSSLAVGNGEYVQRGQIIGYEGNTGNSTGPHLHFEVYQNGSRINPYPFIS